MRVLVADGRSNGGSQSLLFKCPPGGGTPDSAASAYSRVRRHSPRFSRRAAREQFHDRFCHQCSEVTILFGTAQPVTFAPRTALGSIRNALFFRSIKGSLFNQYSLAFVSLTGPAETNNHCRKSAVLPGTPRKGGIAPGQISQVIEVGTA
jgi:hypothetical protein